MRLLISVALCLAFIPAVAAQQTFNNDDVVQLVKLGLGDEAVIAKIHQATVVAFKLETSDLVALKKAGVSGKVIAAMLDRVAPSPAPLAEPNGGVGGGLASGAVVLRASDGSFPLHMRTGEAHESGFAGIGLAFLIFPGASAPVKTSDRRPTIDFTSDVAPEEYYFIAKLDPEKNDNDRSLKIGSFLKGRFSFSTKHLDKPDPDWIIPYDAQEQPAGVWHVRPRTELAPGEYGLYRKGVLWDFAVR